MTINIKKNSNKEWEITEVSTVIKKVEVKADSWDKAQEIYEEQQMRNINQSEEIYIQMKKCNSKLSKPKGNEIEIKNQPVFTL